MSSFNNPPATDQETVDFLEGHIEDPCGVDIGGRTHTIRDFYLRELQRLLPTLLDPAARAKAEGILRAYDVPFS